MSAAAGSGRGAATRKQDRSSRRGGYQPTNPLELRTAFVFAALFVAMLVVTHLVVVHLGAPGVYTLAAIMGVSDVDPFILGLTQGTPAQTP